MKISDIVRNRSWRYSILGLFLGLFAPIGWTVLRLIFFWQEGEEIGAQIVAGITASAESLGVYLYMGFGTALVFGSIGYILGKGAQEIYDRALHLDELNRTVAEQKEEFERRFRELNCGLKNFHLINAKIQKSISFQDVIRLAADGLHEILGYDRVNILMVNRQRQVLEFAAHRGSNDAHGDAITLPLDARAGALFKVVESRQVLLVNDITKLPEEFHLQPPCDEIIALRSRSFIVCPIIVRDEVVGLFGVDYKSQRKKLDETDIDTVKLFADQVSATMVKIELLDSVETLTRELSHTFEELLRYRREHSEHESSLREATASTSESILDVARAVDVVRDVVDTTRSSTAEISVSIDQVSQNLHQLNDFMEKSISAMIEIASTIENVQENAGSSHAMAEKVKQQAENGVASVNSTLEGLQGISVAVEKAVEAIGRLSGKGEEIGGITTVINEITQKTNLLALNAAIIAAQAGEHGRSFAVVAEEVRNLSQEAARSTGAIGRIIEEIQSSTRESVDHIGVTRQLVQENLELGSKMTSSLQQILGSSVQSMEMTHSIRKATKEVSASVESVSVSIEELGEMSSHVTLASREQAQGTRSIVQSIEELKSMADELFDSTEKQKRNTRDIELAVAAVSNMTGRIFTALEERQQGSREVIERLEGMKRLEGNA
ncbi:MAG: methyl-accepting chemotaxis protein [Desulfuromonadales bacterium]